MRSPVSIIDDLEQLTNRRTREKDKIWAIFYPAGLDMIISQSSQYSLIRNFVRIDQLFPKYHQDIVNHLLRKGLSHVFNEKEGFWALKKLKDLQQSFPSHRNQILESLLAFHSRNLYQICSYPAHLKELLAMYPEHRESIFQALVPLYIQSLITEMPGWFMASQIGKIAAVFPQEKNAILELLLPTGMSKIILDAYNVKSLLRDIRYLVSIFRTQKDQILTAYLGRCIEAVISIKESSQLLNFIDPFNHTFPEYTDEIWDIFYRIGLPRILAETSVDRLVSEITEIVIAFPMHQTQIWLDFRATSFPRMITKADSIDLANSIKMLKNTFPVHKETIESDLEKWLPCRPKSVNKPYNNATFFKIENHDPGSAASEKYEWQSNPAETF